MKRIIHEKIIEMTEAKQKAKEMADRLGLDKAKLKCKDMLATYHYLIINEPSDLAQSNSNAFQYWGDVMDELNEMV